MASKYMRATLDNMIRCKEGCPSDISNCMDCPYRTDSDEELDVLYEFRKTIEALDALKNLARGDNYGN